MLISAAVVAVLGVGFAVSRVNSGTTRSTVHSAALGRGMPIEVYTPSHPCRDEPVLLLFHGRGGDERQWMEGSLFDGVGIDATAARLIAAGEIRPITIVSASIDDSYGVDSVPTNDDYDHGPYGTYILDELIPAVAERYGEGGRAPIFIGGLSMGGYAALNVAFRHPGLFAGVGALSPALWLNPPTDREWMYASEDGRSILDVAAAGAGNGMRLFIGRGDDDYDWIKKSSDQLHDRLAAAGVSDDYTVTSGGHNGSTWRALSEPMLKALFGTTSPGCEL